MAVIRFEVWTRPESGTFVRRFPLKGVVNYGLSLGIFGRGNIVLPKEFGRLDEIIYVDPADHSNDNASMIRAYIDDTHLYDFYAARADINFGDMGERVVNVTGGGPGTALDRVFVFPYDYNLNPSIQPDWDYGGDNDLLENEGFEDDVINGTFEEGTISPWKPLSGSDTNDLDVDLKSTVAEARTGTYSLEVDPGKRHSGGELVIDCVPGEEMTIAGFVKCNTVGRRITAAVKKEDGMTFASTNGYLFGGWHIVEIGNVARNTAHNGLPGGSADGTWQALGTILVTPGAETETLRYTVQDDHHNDTNGPIFYVDDVTRTGIGVGLRPWEPYLLTVMEPDAVTFREGVQSAKCTGPNGASIYQDFDGMTAGVVYSAGFWVRHAEGIDKSLIAQYTVDGNAAVTVSTAYTVVTATWTYISVTWTATQDTGRVEVKNNSGGIITWWVDETSAGQGLGKENYGKIMGDFLDDAATDHAATRTALDFLVKTFTDTLDTDTVAWDKKVSFSVKRGQPYRRIVTFHGDNFGYEADIHPNAADDSIIEFDLFNIEAMGQDFTTGDAGAVTKSGLVSVGPFIRREPLSTYAMVEGDGQNWGEDTDAVLETAWGEIETYEGSDEVKVGTLTDLAARLTGGKEAETIVAKFQNPNLTPGVDYKLGDIVWLNLGEDILPAAAYRVMSIDVSAGTPEPMFQVQFVSEGL